MLLMTIIKIGAQKNLLIITHKVTPPILKIIPLNTIQKFASQQSLLEIYIRVT